MDGCAAFLKINQITQNDVKKVAGLQLSTKGDIDEIIMVIDRWRQTGLEGLGGTPTGGRRPAKRIKEDTPPPRSRKLSALAGRQSQGEAGE